MLIDLANRILEMLGKHTRVPKEFPTGFLLAEGLSKSLALVRGILRGRGYVFVHRRVVIRGRNAKIGHFVTLEHDVSINTFSKDGIEIGMRSKIGAYTIISATNHFSRLGKGVRMGSDSGIGQFGFIGALGGVEIGNDVIMGQYVSFHASNHSFQTDDIPIRLQGSTCIGIRIESDVWVGAKVTFLDGTVVRSHSVVAAGAVVSGEFPPNVIIGGVPARILRHIGETEGPDATAP